MGRYKAWTYWVAVAMVGVFGTMAADVLHVRFGVAYTESTILYAAILVAVFATWQHTEKTLSIHTINTARREAFYWAAVVATFAMGTALGDLTSVTFHLGYFVSGVMFAALILIPAIGYRWFGMNSILAFWIAYVLTRPVGASFADWFGKPVAFRGLGYGAGTVAGVLAVIIFILVAFLAITHADEQRPDQREGERDRRRHVAEDRVR
jgi:uncharacterized membrane-anchored protein